MKFSLNNLANNIDGPATNGNRSKMTQEIKSTNADTNIQINPGTSGSLVIKNTAKLLGGLALAAMVAMAATFGSVSAGSPSITLMTAQSCNPGVEPVSPLVLNCLGHGDGL